MIRVTSGAPVTIDVPLVDDDGNAIVPTAASWELLDETDALLTSGDCDLTAGSAQVVVAGAFNIIVEPRGIRCVRVAFALPNGTTSVDTFYTIERLNVLRPLQNSFQTYAAALMERETFGGLFDGWDVAGQSERVSALEHAFIKIARMTFAFSPDDPKQYASFDEDDRSSPNYLLTDIASTPPEVFAKFPERFRRALARAQVLEANNLLGGDVVGQRRRDGILSETTGESSMMFNQRPALDLPLSRDAYREIAPYVFRRIGLVRG